MTKPPQPTPFPLRMPDDLRPRLEARAKLNRRSANAEIVAILTAALDAQSNLAEIPVEVLLKEVVDRLGATVHISIPKEEAGRARIKPTGK